VNITFCEEDLSFAKATASRLCLSIRGGSQRNKVTVGPCKWYGEGQEHFWWFGVSAPRCISHTLSNNYVHIAVEMPLFSTNRGHIGGFNAALHLPFRLLILTLRRRGSDSNNRDRLIFVVFCMVGFTINIATHIATSWLKFTINITTNIAAS